MSTRQWEGASVRRSPLDRGVVIETLDRTTRNLSRVLCRYGGEDRPIPHMTWSVGQCAAHMLISNWMYAHQFEGPGAHLRIEDTSAMNDWSVAPFADLRPSDLAHEMRESTTHLLDVASSYPEDATFTWWSGSSARVETGLGLLVGERLIHGWDIARALGVPWRIDARDAAVAMAASIAVMPLIVDTEAAAGMDGTLEIRLRGAERYSLRFDDGALTTAEETEPFRANCRISADPVAMLLVGYGRVSQWGQAMRGRMSVWGRKPWLAMSLARVLRNP